MVSAGDRKGTELLRNVWDNRAGSNHTDAVNNTDLRVRRQNCGSPSWTTLEL